MDWGKWRQQCWYLFKKTVKYMIGSECSACTLQNTIQHGTDCLPINIESTVLMIFSFFYVYTVHTEKLKDISGFAELNQEVLLWHSKTRWLSLLPAIKKIFKLSPTLKLYFSQQTVPTIVKEFFEMYLLFKQSYVFLFHTKITVERRHYCVIEVSDMLNSVQK